MNLISFTHWNLLMKWQAPLEWFRSCWSSRFRMVSIIFRKTWSFHFAMSLNVTSVSSLIQKPCRYAPERSFLLLDTPHSSTPPPIIYLFLFCMCHCLCTHLAYFYSSHLKKKYSEFTCFFVSCHSFYLVLLASVCYFPLYCELCHLCQCTSLDSECAVDFTEK